MKNIENFSMAGISAIREFLDALSPEDKNRVDKLMALGHPIAVSLTINSDGSTRVNLEFLLPDEKRLSLAHADGKYTYKRAQLH